MLNTSQIAKFSRDSSKLVFFAPSGQSVTFPYSFIVWWQWLKLTPHFVRDLVCSKRIMRKCCKLAQTKQNIKKPNQPNKQNPKNKQKKPNNKQPNSKLIPKQKDTQQQLKKTPTPQLIFLFYLASRKVWKMLHLANCFILT